MTDFETWGPPEPVSPPSCCNCFSLLEAPDEDGWSRCPGGCGHFRVGYSEGTGALPIDNFRDLPQLAREDSDALLDMAAAERVGTDRSFGG